MFCKMAQHPYDETMMASSLGTKARARGRTNDGGDGDLEDSGSGRALV